MAFSKVEVTFVSVPNVNDLLILDNSLAIPQITEAFKALRSANNETTIGGGVDDSAFFYADALSLDYGSSGLYIVLWLILCFAIFEIIKLLLETI